MPVTNAISYSVGSALLSSAGQAANAASGTPISSLSIQWIPGMSARGPGFSTQTIAVGSGIVSTWNTVVVGMAGSLAPLYYIIGSIGASFQTIQSFSNVNLPPSAWAEAIKDAMVAAIFDLCGATFLSDTISTYTLPGFGVQFCSIGHIIAASGEVISQFQVVVANQNVQATGSSSYGIPTILMGGQPATINTLIAPITLPAQAPPMDLDIGINNGANIFSINSKTFTEPG
jgi:hypothetical protein